MTVHDNRSAARDATTTADYLELYKDLHRHPELGLHEHRTAGIVADRLRAAGLEVTTGIGGTGVAGVLRNGDGPVVCLRAEMDALPVHEETGLDYASTVTAEHDDLGEVDVAHACGHDLHVACLVAAVDTLVARRTQWRGTLVALAQPGEETGHGARRMVADRLFQRVPSPDVLLAQHVAPAPVGVCAVHSDLVMGASDTVDLTFVGRGGHGSQPEACIDPVLMAASFIVRVQSLVSRRLPSTTPAVVTVGAVHAGSMAATIPGTAHLKINIRAEDDATMTSILGWVRELAASEAASWNAPEPELRHVYHLPALRNDRAASHTVRAALTERLGARAVLELPPVSASEDVGLLAEGAGCVSVYWFFGGMTDASPTEDGGGYPSNHSARFAPDPHAALPVGADCLVAAFLSFTAERTR